ncbi:MAG: tetratricopeptide repeat protein [Gemmatimonadetes bacterium]|nr:tetratricopeptide repeat protein [Gemmatimonadota bacterium]
MPFRSLTKAPCTTSALVFVIVCLANLQALQTEEFHYDDGHSLVRNQSLSDLSNLPGFFVSGDMFGENPDDLMYRPLVLVANSLNLALGGMRPGSFVAANVLIHGLTAACVTWWLTLLIPRASPLILGLLFGLHPLQSETIHYISARAESLSGLFMMLSLATFVHYQRRQEITGSPHLFWGVASLGSFVLGLLCKATAIVTPALILLSLLTESKASGSSSSGLKKTHDLRSISRLLLPYALISILYLILHQHFTYSISDNSLRSLSEQLLTQSKALVHYLTNTIMPIRLSILPQFSPSGHLELTVVASIAAVISLAVVAWKSRRTLPLFAGLGWFVACLSPTLVVPLNVLVNDHRTYVALTGIIWVVGVLTQRMSRSPSRRFVAVAAVAVMLLLSWNRTAAWQTENAIWADAVHKGPQMAIAQYNLGFSQHLAGQFDRSISHYRSALRIDANYVRPMNNLAALLRDRGDLAEARSLLQTAAAIEPDNAEVLNNLGMALAADGEHEHAVRILLRANALMPLSAEIWLNLGLAQRDTGLRSEAMQSLQRALQLDPAMRQRLAP